METTPTTTTTKEPKQNTIAIRQRWKKKQTRVATRQESKKKKNKYKIQTKDNTENGRLGPFSRTYTGVMHRHSSRYVPNIFSFKIFQTDSLNQDQRQPENRQNKNKTIGTKEKVNLLLFSFTLIFVVVVVVVASPCQVRLTEFERVSCEKKRRFLTHQKLPQSHSTPFFGLLLLLQFLFSFFFLFCVNFNFNGSSWRQFSPVLTF